MVKLALLDVAHNNVKTVNAFGTDIKFTSLYLNNNSIETIPTDLCGFTEDVEGLNFSP